MDNETDKLIIDSFVNFVSQFNLVDKDNLEATIDDTISSYISNTIKQLLDEYESHKIWLDDKQAEKDFDIESFVEIIDAYLFGFNTLENSSIVRWLINLKKEIDLFNKNLNKNPTNSDQVSLVEDHKTLKENGQDKSATTAHKKKLADQDTSDPNLNLLIEMFPKMDIKQIDKMYKKTNSNYEKTIDCLLTMTESSVLAESSEDEDNLREEERLALKEKTVQKFGFIPVNEDGTPITTTKAPTNVWNNEKKLIRFYDSKVVTTKGEKYFELKTAEDEEREKEMKKTYCHLKPARKYRFH